MNNKRICQTFAKYLTDKCIPHMYYPMLLFMCSSVTGWCMLVMLWGEPLLRRLYLKHTEILSGMAVIGVSVVAIDAIISIAISIFF